MNEQLKYITEQVGTSIEGIREIKFLPEQVITAIYNRLKKLEYACEDYEVQIKSLEDACEDYEVQIKSLEDENLDLYDQLEAI